jgi:arginine/lysine/ornithine decarboxylase
LAPSKVTNAIDRTRLTVGVANLGLTGFEADEQLLAVGVAAELPALLHLTFILSIGTTDRDIDRLVQGLSQLASRPGTSPRPILHLPPIPLAPLTPRDAFFAERESVSIAAAIDRISAEIVCPYPPGIPLLLPGEQITSEAIDYLQQVIDAGGVVTGCDVDRGTVQVVKRSPVSLS